MLRAMTKIFDVPAIEVSEYEAKQLIKRKLHHIFVHGKHWTTEEDFGILKSKLEK